RILSSSIHFLLGTAAAHSATKPGGGPRVKPISRPFSKCVRSDGVVMKILFPAIGAAAALALFSVHSEAEQRYAEPPPLVVSPDLSAPWVLQLRRAPRGVAVAPAPASRDRVQRYQPGDPLPSRAAYQRLPAPDLRNSYVIQQGPGRAPKVVPMYTPQEMRQPFDPKFLPR